MSFGDRYARIIYSADGQENVTATWAESNNCGCVIEGDGSHEKPLFINFCVPHSAGYAMFAKWEDERFEMRNRDGS